MSREGKGAGKGAGAPGAAEGAQSGEEESWGDLLALHKSLRGNWWSWSEMGSVSSPR